MSQKGIKLSGVFRQKIASKNIGYYAYEINVVTAFHNDGSSPDYDPSFSPINGTSYEIIAPALSDTPIFCLFPEQVIRKLDELERLSEDALRIESLS